jgi:hypothetical protein
MLQVGKDVALVRSAGGGALPALLYALVVVVIRLMKGAVVATAVRLSWLWADLLQWYRQPVT